MEYVFNCYMKRWLDTVPAFRNIEDFYSPNTSNPRTQQPYDGNVRYRMADGIESKGKPKSLYKETYADSEITRLSFNPSIKRDNTTITFTFVFFGNERQDLYQDFYDYVRNSPMVYWDDVRKRCAILVLDTATAPKEDIYLTNIPHIEVDFKFTNLCGETHQCDSLNDATSWSDEILSASMLDDSDYMYFYNNGLTSATVALQEYGSPNLAINLECSTDKKNWNTLVSGQTRNTITIPSKSKLYVRARGTYVNSRFATSKLDYNHFVFTGGTIYCGGSMKSLVSKTLSVNTLTENYAFAGLFAGSAIKSAPTYDFTNTTSHCCCSIFANCSELIYAFGTIAAETIKDGAFENYCLNAIKLKKATDFHANGIESSALKCAFFGCTSLKSMAYINIPATAANCFEDIYNGCTSLEYTSSINQSVMAQYCYRRAFYGTAIKKTPDFKNPVTPSISCFQSMFENCESLVEVKNMNVVSNVSTGWSESMFKGCSNLKNVKIGNAPQICAEMFKDCSELESVTLPQDTMAVLENVNAFSNNSLIRKIYVKPSLLAQYQAAQNWSSISSAIEAIQ